MQYPRYMSTCVRCVYTTVPVLALACAPMSSDEQLLIVVVWLLRDTRHMTCCVDRQHHVRTHYTDVLVRVAQLVLVQ